ncbi:MAG: hypothetical protein IKW85_00380 [Muribaculaceae bacterium]|nr:hypothetical protein [Muribaculaceae bacterium]
MKKLTILLAAVALMAMTACNEKPAKNEAQGDKNAPTEKVDTTKQKVEVKPNVESPTPTADGKDHVLTEFNTKEYQVRLENMADGSYRISLWKAGKDKSAAPDEVAQSKNCKLSGKEYLMKCDDGKTYLIKGEPGKELLSIVTDKSIVYMGNAVK